MRIRRWRRAYLAAEYAALFFGGTTLYNAVLRGKPPIPALLILGTGVTVYLRRSKGFDRQSLWRAEAFPAQARSMAVGAGPPRPREFSWGPPEPPDPRPPGRAGRTRRWR